jgi:hypothetical protein
MTAQPSPAALASASEAVAHLREEADFNRSWIDGRQPPTDISPAYADRRREVAAARERWADAIDALIAAQQGGRA